MEHTVKAFNDQKNKKGKKGPLTSHLIVIVKPNKSELISQASSGIISALATYVDYPQIISINGDNDAEGLTALLRATLNHYPKIDFIFSLGLLATKLVQAVTRELKRPITTYFIGVIDPVENGIVTSLEKPGSYITGTSILSRNYDEQVEGLLDITGQSFQHAIVPYCDLGGNVRTEDKDFNGMINALKRRNIRVSTVNITQGKDIIDNVKPLLHQADMICIPRDTLIMEYAPTFIEIANQQGITLFTSDTDSVIQGAAIGFGSSAYEFTREVSMLPQPLLIDGHSPTTFPVAVYSHWKGHIAINKEAAEKQNLSINMDRVFAQGKCKAALW